MTEDSGADEASQELLYLVGVMTRSDRSFRDKR